MDLQTLFEDNDIWDLPEERLKYIEEIEFETYLDNLGYISILQNDEEREIDWKEIGEGIAKFRAEYQESFDFFVKHAEIFTELYPLPIIGPEDALSLKEEEISFMEHLSTLEGEFEIHKLRKTKIRKNKILKRVLNFRLSILGLPASKQANQYGKEINQSLLKLSSWLGTDKFTDLVHAIGDMEYLSLKLIDNGTLTDTTYPHIVYFFDKKGNIGSSVKSDKERFSERLKFLPEPVIQIVNELNKKKIKWDAFHQLVDADINLFVTRLVQIRLWLLGTYEGKLDSDIGQLTVKAIKDLVSYLHNAYNKKKGKKIDPRNKLGISEHDFIRRVGKRRKAFALNATFLLKYVFPIFIEDSLQEKADTSIEAKSGKEVEYPIAFDISTIGNKLEEAEQQDLYRQLDLIIQDDIINFKNRKANTTGGKGLFRTINRFFRNLYRKAKERIGKIVDNIIQAIKEFFGWIKNGIKILLTELKKVFHGIRLTIKSFFGRKLIKSEASSKFLSTTFDSDFDSISTLNRLDTDLLREHLAKNYEFLENLRRGSKFMGICIQVILNLPKPGFGWLKVGLTILRELRNKRVEPFKYRYAKLQMI